MSAQGKSMRLRIEKVCVCVRARESIHKGIFEIFVCVWIGVLVSKHLCARSTFLLIFLFMRFRARDAWGSKERNLHADQRRADDSTRSWIGLCAFVCERGGKHDCSAWWCICTCHFWGDALDVVTKNFCIMIDFSTDHFTLQIRRLSLTQQFGDKSK